MQGTEEEMNDRDLAGAVREWFNRMTTISGQARRKNPVWVVLREIAVAFGNWRNAPRGNPSKGFSVMKGRIDE